MPLYEYECQRCHYKFEELRPMGSDPSDCPECGGRIKRLISKPSIHYKGPGFFSTDNREDGRVKAESGKLGRKVSETDLSHFEEGVKIDKKGGPHITPTRPKPSR